MAEKDICIQPVYVIDSLRSSKQKEMEVMDKILSEMKAGKEFKAEIKPIQYFDKDKILKEYKNGEISNAFQVLRAKYSLGIQYEWFALLAEALDCKVECGVEMSERSKAGNAIRGEGKLTLLENDFLGKRYCVEKETSSWELNLVFGNIILGIFDITKKDAEAIAREKGWIDIMKLTWFCHSPIAGKPCGMCNPCKDAMNEEMEWRMPTISRWRYKYLSGNFAGRLLRKVNSIYTTKFKA